jgi:hypothetical protein
MLVHGHPPACTEEAPGPGASSFPSLIVCILPDAHHLLDLLGGLLGQRLIALLLVTGEVPRTHLTGRWVNRGRRRGLSRLSTFEAFDLAAALHDEVKAPQTLVEVERLHIPFAALPEGLLPATPPRYVQTYFREDQTE